MMQRMIKFYEGMIDMGLKRAMMIGLDAADPLQLQRLMDEGRMPNLKKLLENGAAHEGLDMIGCLPSVTPPNWASIATGAWPRTHGITCYTNHTLGMPLAMQQSNWDTANIEAELIWETFSKNKKRSILMNYCEAWPPRIPDDEYQIVIDGSGVCPFLRCNVDYQKIVYMEEGDFATKFTPHVIKKDNKDCVVMGDQYEEMKATSASIHVNEFEDFVGTMPTVDSPCPPELPGVDLCHSTLLQGLQDELVTPLKNPANWSFELPEGARECTIFLAKNTVRRFAVLTASDGVHYDTVTIYKNKRTPEPLGSVTGKDNWSGWIFDTYMKNDEEIKVAYKIYLMDVEADGSKAMVYFSHTTNMSNLDFFYPKAMGEDLYNAVGPMMQYGQILGPGHPYEKTAHKILFETYARDQNEWEADATEYLFEKYPDWQLYYVHLHSIDNFQHWYLNKTLPGSCENPEYYRDLIDRVYEENDKFIGRMMKHLDGDTTIIVTSDHGAIPHSVGDEYPGIGGIGVIATKVMTDLGYTVIEESNDPVWAPMGVKVNWEKTKAISTRTSYIYINLKGRDPEGIVEPEEYDELVQQIISDLYSYRDENGKRVIAHCFTRDEQEFLGMGGPHCGDILFQLTPTFCCEHANCFSTVRHEGCSLGNACILGGAGIREGVIFRRPIRITDIVPTICYLTDTPMPPDVEGGIIYQALKDFE